MAKEYFTSFGSIDILEVVLQCTNCRGELSLPVGRKPRVLDKCPICFAEWDRERHRAR